MQINDSICPVCEEFSFDFPDDYDICPVCGWENDGVQRAKRDYWGGANSLSVNESRTVFLLLKDEKSKDKISELLDKYKQRNQGNTQKIP